MELIAVDGQLLARPDQYVVTHDAPQVVQCLPQGPPRFLVSQLGPEQRQQEVPPHRSPFPFEGQIGEQGQPLGLDRGGARRIAGAIPVEADATECLELDHGEKA